MRFLLFLLMSLLSACSDQRPVKFEQLHRGANGPERTGVEYISSEKELENSWIKTAVSEAAYRQLFRRVDFSSQIIVVFSAGATEAFSGKVEILDIYQYTGVESLPINVLVKLGVQKDDCRVSRVSWPVVIAVAERPPRFQPYGGYDVQFFQDDCT